MHHNILARYNAERLSNGLSLVEPLTLENGANIGSGYDSGLEDATSQLIWTPRPQNTLLADVIHGTDPDFELNVTMSELTALLQLIVADITSGSLKTTKGDLSLGNQEGIDVLGNTVEAVDLSVNMDRYHSYGIHNLGHIAIALATDPGYTLKVPTGVMGDTATAMRDPAFYRMHGLVDDLIDLHKKTLEPYRLEGGDWPLIWEGVTLQKMEVIPRFGNGGRNFLKTFWNVKKFPLEGGIYESGATGDTSICHRHLDHEPFTFKLEVIRGGCLDTASGKATVRVFLAPRYDLEGRRFGMEETRKLMFQLDAFPVELKPGRNLITRHSGDSALTKPWSRSFREMREDPGDQGNAEYCGCGWPQHLLIPKGSVEGTHFDLFAMVTKFEEDEVPDSEEDLKVPEPCRAAWLMCGVPFRKYPDKRPMGYPFDRRAYSVAEGDGNGRPVETLDEYVAFVPNMRSILLAVQHVEDL